MTMAWKQIINNTSVIPIQTPCGLSKFFSKSTPSVVKVGILEFLNGVRGGFEAHVAKLESEIGNFPKLLDPRTLKLKKLEEADTEIRSQFTNIAWHCGGLNLSL